ncbi:MAG: hypothetical protein ACI8V4_002414, partial [Ilumatobacter sp.]
MTHRDAIHATSARKRSALKAPVVQRKLADDSLEREADHVAFDVLVRLASQSIRRIRETNDAEQRVCRSTNNKADQNTHGSMETAFGADFGGVRIHT